MRRPGAYYIVEHLKGIYLDKPKSHPQTLDKAGKDYQGPGTNTLAYYKNRQITDKKCFMRLTPGCVDEEDGVLLDLVDLGVVVVSHDHLHGSLLVEGLHNLFIRYRCSGKIS
jgi:hypothetical protein